MMFVQSVSHTKSSFNLYLSHASSLLSPSPLFSISLPPFSIYSSPLIAARSLESATNTFFSMLMPENSLLTGDLVILNEY